MDFRSNEKPTKKSKYQIFIILVGVASCRIPSPQLALMHTVQGDIVRRLERLLTVWAVRHNYKTGNSLFWKLSSWQ